MIDVSRLQKVLLPILFVVFFLCFHFLLRLGMMISVPRAHCNPSGPFGIFFPKWILLILSLFVLLFLFSLFTKSDDALFRWSLVVLLAGGMGNFLERIFFGCILDYISLPFFPVFNGADILLTIGVIGILSQIYIQNKNHCNKKL